MQLPEFLIEKLKSQYGEELKNEIVDGYSKRRVTTFRVNTIKSNNDEIEQVLKSLNFEYEKPSWSEDAYILKNNSEQDIENLDIYKDGKGTL